jgi:hypothetical protein
MVRKQGHGSKRCEPGSQNGYKVFQLGSWGGNWVDLPGSLSGCQIRWVYAVIAGQSGQPGSWDESWVDSPGGPPVVGGHQPGRYPGLPTRLPDFIDRVARLVNYLA